MATKKKPTQNKTVTKVSTPKKATTSGASAYKSKNAESFTIDVDDLFKRLSDKDTPEATPEKAEPGLDKEVAKIYAQASNHRELLIHFYIFYTVALSLFVLAIICVQAYVRIHIQTEQAIEIVPQWALYLLVVGMFGQFIGLLTIVTKKVWTYEPFFKHAGDHHNRKDE